MKKMILTLCLSLALLLSPLVLPLTQYHLSSTCLEMVPITSAEMRTTMEATIQIFMFSIDSDERLQVDQQQISNKLSDLINVTIPEIEKDLETHNAPMVR